MTIRAVIFDLDGTIAIFNLDYRAVRGEVRSHLIAQGIPASILASNESIFELLKKTEIYLKNTGRKERDFLKAREKALAIAEAYELEAARTTSLLPGVIETLKALKKTGLKIGLCTINSEKSSNHILERFRIKDFFDAVTPRDKVKYVKPNSEHLESTLKALGVNPDETVVVGDGAVDMNCASQVKAIAVGLVTDTSSREMLAAAGANYVITSITDLPALVDRISNMHSRQRTEPM